MNSTIRVGIAGCGKMATSSHIPGFGGLPGIKVTALFDISSERAESARKDLVPGAELFADFNTMVASGKVDAVAICTPNSFHHPQTLVALKAGLHVLCEKPMAATLSEATEMVEAARQAKRVLQINHSCRYIPLYMKIAELIESGQIGKPRHARCIRAGGATPDVGWSPGASWFVQKKNQGGIVLDIGIHMADMLRWYMGDVDSIAALTDTWKEGIDATDNVSALFRFQSGATGILELSWTLPAGASLLEIYGSTGTIRTGFGNAPIELIRAVNDKTIVQSLEPSSGTPDSFQCFAGAIRGETPTWTPGEYGWRALALCEAIIRSSATGKFEKVSRLACTRKPKNGSAPKPC